MSNNEFSDLKQVHSALLQEARRAIKIVQRIWKEYENSYTPQQYVRKYKVRDGLSQLAIGKVEMIDNDTIGVKIEFKDDLMFHPSIINKDGKPEGNAFLLISEGWRVKSSAKHSAVYRFGYYEGFNIIQKVKDAFEAEKIHKGVTLEFTWKNVLR